MNFLCSLLSQKDYFVEVYTLPAKNRSSSTDSQTGSQSESRQNILMDHPPTLNAINISYTANHQDISTSTTLEGPRVSPFKFNINPEQLGQLIAQYQMIDSKKIQKEQVAHLLRHKEKWIKGEKKNIDELVVRMIKKSQFDVIIASDYKGKKWRDNNFQQKKTYKAQNIELPLRWDSLQSVSAKLLKAPSTFMHRSTAPIDIRQGTVGDCYFLSAVAALTRCPERIMRLFPDIRKLGKNGAYMARMMFKGILQQVVVDDIFPVQVNDQKFLGCQPSADNETYVMILEKCWAKLWKSYDAIDGGMPHEALHALTGAPTKNYILSEQTATEQTKQSFFSQVLKYSINDFVMCVGTGLLGQRHVTIQHQTLGQVQIKVVNQHIYCIEQFFVKDGNKMVRIYNPWGYNVIDSDQNVQGEVNITWDEFLSNFTYLTACKVYDNANYLYMQMENCKKNKFTFVQLDVFQVNSGCFTITVSETDKKEKEDIDHQYLNVTYVVLKEISSSNTKDQKKQYELKAIRTQHKFSDHYLELNDMTVGKYIIAIHFSEVQVKQHLTFGVYSSDIFGFSEKQMSATFCDNFLHSSLISYDRKQVKEESRIYPFPGNTNIWASFNMMVKNSSLGYFLLHVDKSEKRGVKAMMGSNAFKQKMLRVWDQNNDIIKFTAGQGQETMAIISTDSFRKYKEREQECLQNYKKNQQNKRHFHQDILIQYTFL